MSEVMFSFVSFVIFLLRHLVFLLTSLLAIHLSVFQKCDVLDHWHDAQ